MSGQNICNICGANFEYRNGRWICPACGAYKAEELSNEEVTLLYSATQKLRFSDFDEAEKSYTDIIEKYPQNPNGYWGRLLSKYGIKYEEDFDGRKIPTCYATSIESITLDRDYTKAISLADADTKAYYLKQAEYIERVRKEWVEKASKEKPYDIFICYKDSDFSNGINRTQDSIDVQDLYIHLTKQGYCVFFSRESLRDKVGEKYEPYIFAALSTAKIMLVYASKPEYITSTWLKNEWTRYEKRLRAGEKKPNSLLVACDGFSPNELPKVLASKQCFDAKRKTFYIDLDKCIKHILQEDSANVSSHQNDEKAHWSELHEHTYKTKVVKSTCIAKGYTVHTCDCGYEYRDSYTPLVDHDFKLDERVEPTCTKDGYEKKTCKICGESITNKLSACGHQFSKWVETKHPTCIDDGEAQRQCVKCGYVEKRTLNKIGHQFSDWSATQDGSQTRHCQNCGISQSKDIGTDNVSTDTSDSQRELKNVVAIKNVFSNWVSYWKSFFNSETTRAQKAVHFSWYSVLVAMMVLFATIESNTIDESSVTITSGITAIALIVMIFCIPLGIGALIALFLQKIKLRRNNLPMSQSKYSRTWLKVISNFLFIYCPLFASLAFSTNDPTDAPAIMLAVMFAIWATVTLFYAHCPRKFKQIQVKNSLIVRRSQIAIIGLIATAISFVVMIVWIVLVTS